MCELEGNLRCWSSTFTLFQMGSYVYCRALKVGWSEGFSCLHLPSHCRCSTASSFMWVPGGLNLGPHTCTASILHTELSLLPEKQNSSVCLSVWLLGIMSLFHSSGGLWMIVIRSSETLKTREPSEASEADP